MVGRIMKYTLAPYRTPQRLDALNLIRTSILHMCTMLQAISRLHSLHMMLSGIYFIFTYFCGNYLAKVLLDQLLFTLPYKRVLTCIGHSPPLNHPTPPMFYCTFDFSSHYEVNCSTVIEVMGGVFNLQLNSSQEVMLYPASENIHWLALDPTMDHPTPPMFMTCR